MVMIINHWLLLLIIHTVLITNLIFFYLIFGLRKYVAKVIIISPDIFVLNL